MNAGFITKKREEQLWEVQRLITQLKRKLRSFEKKQEKSIDELDGSSASQPVAAAHPVASTSAQAAAISADNVSEDMTDSKSAASHNLAAAEPQIEELSTSSTPPTPPSIDYTLDSETGYLLLPKSNPQRDELLRLQIEYDELMTWQNELKARILAERNEIFRLKQLYEQEQQRPPPVPAHGITPSHIQQQEQGVPEPDYERIIEHYARENALLEHKKKMLSKELKEERRACITLHVELRMKDF